MASPVFAPPDVKDVTLSLFAGMKTDVAPSDLPEGLTPDTQDGIYLPGQWQSRPGVGRLYATGKLTPGSTVLYEKTYVQPNDEPLTLLLTSDGTLWAEDVTNDPGNPAVIGEIAAGLSAQSVTAFGREYIAISDLLHGQGVPLQFDGTNLDRVTQDGPGLPAQVIDYVVPFTIAAAGVPGLQMAFNGLTIHSISQIGFTVTIDVTSIFSPAQAGDAIKIAGVGTTGYNGTWTVSAVARSGGLHFLISYVNTVSGLPADSSGTASFTIVEVQTTAAAPFVLGQNLVIAGATNASYDGTWPLRNRLSSTIFYVKTNQFSLPNSGAGTIGTGGVVTAGTHQLVCTFLTRQGFLTKPSPIFSWTATGGFAALVTSLPIGPANVVARVLGMTGAGGADFFTLLAAPQVGGVVVGTSLLIPDNTSTSAIISIADNSLFSGIPIDQIGNDLFDQVVLGPVLGFFAYASRLTCWGDYQKIENFLNMGFCGGIGNPLVPDGWTLDTTGGILVTGITNAPWVDGYSWQITGDGTTNPLGTHHPRRLSRQFRRSDPDRRHALWTEALADTACSRPCFNGKHHRRFL